MFPLRLLIVSCVTIVILFGSSDAFVGEKFEHMWKLPILEFSSFSAVDVNIAFETCCKTGLGLKTCTEEAINQTSHNPPTGFCRSVLKLCCLSTKRRNTVCSRTFIATGFDHFCSRAVEKHQTCCAACQAGRQMAAESATCFKLEVPKSSSINYAPEVVFECCIRQKRKDDRRKPESLQSCRVGFHYSQRSRKCEDLNECEIFNNGCESWQDCKNLLGSYTCTPRSICKRGYEFNLETLKCDPDDRLTFPVVTEIINGPDELVPDAISMDSSPLNVTLTTMIWRECRPGLRLNNLSYACDDVDECADANPCDFNSKCINNFGSFSCQCNPGYEQNFNNCVDVDECRLEAKPCDHHCANRQGSYSCHCNRGFNIDAADNSTCRDRNECVENRKLCSHDCRNLKGSYRCGCPPGLRLGHDKRTCEDINECVEKRGVCGSKICNNLIGGYACYPSVCPEGFKTHHFSKRNDFK